MFFKKQENTALKIIIVGGGKVGTAIIEQLVKEGHEITVIDKNPTKIRSLANIYDVMGIIGNGASYNTQKEAGIDEADLIIAVTGSDELNLLCCTVARKVGSCDAIARVRTPEYGEEKSILMENLDLAMIINPELEASVEAARILYLPNALEVFSFAHGQAELVRFKLPKDNTLDNKMVSSIDQELTKNIIFCAIERDNEVHIPDGRFVLKGGDTISFISTRVAARKFLKKIGMTSHTVKKCMLIGGGRTAYYLGKQLIDMNMSVKIIESDFSRCEELSILLPEATIIHGDGTDEDLLKEEGIEVADAFIPITGLDEQNIMLTLYAKTESDAKVITKINHIGFNNIISSLDLGSVIYPKRITVDAIIAYVRSRISSMGNSIETMYKLFDSRAEAMEFFVPEGSKASGTALMNMKLKPNLRIASIYRKGKIIIPSGRSIILPGDSVMVVTTNTGLNNIDEILA